MSAMRVSRAILNENYGAHLCKGVGKVALYRVGCSTTTTTTITLSLFFLILFIYLRITPRVFVIAYNCLQAKKLMNLKYASLSGVGLVRWWRFCVYIYMFGWLDFCSFSIIYIMYVHTLIHSSLQQSTYAHKSVCVCVFSYKMRVGAEMGLTFIHSV